MTGVGGQGIGMLSEVLIRAAHYAGHKVKGVDTHGLAQRGGVVISQLRLGNAAYSPLIRSNEADLAVALEIHESLRAMNRALKDGGTLVYYNISLQPLEVRLGAAKSVSEKIVKDECIRRKIKYFAVLDNTLSDHRMQNICVLGKIAKENLVPGLKKEHYISAMDDLMTGKMAEANINLFNNHFDMG